MNENIDLTKILKDCLKGIKFYSTLYGEVEFDKIKKESEYPIVIITKHGNNSDIKSDGRYYGDYDGGECILFPSKDQRDWRKFTAPWYKKSEPKFKVGDWLCTNELNNDANLIKIVKIVDVFGKKRYKISRDYDSDLDLIEFDFIEKHYHLWNIQDAKDGDVIFYDEGWICIFKCIHGIWYSSYCFITDDGEFHTGYERHAVDFTIHGNVHPATKEQRDILMKAMNNAGYKWNAETKTLEKLVEPKFKVGDRIRHKESNKDDVYVISKVYDDAYGVVGLPWMIYMKYQDRYELVPNKFDVTTLQPFDKVLVRDSSDRRWRCAIFSHVRKEDENYTFKYVTTACTYEFCIPFNDDTKHLVGTTEEAPKYYRYWED